MDKRTFIKSSFLGIAGVFTLGLSSKLKAAKSRKKWNGEFVLPELPYPYDALEPFFDSETMALHHSKHHAAYTNNFNAAVKAAGLTGKTAHEILSEISKYPAAIRNNGGGYLNHKMFWKMIAPATGKQPSKELVDALIRDFGSLDAFKEKFGAAARTVFGSGWAWLIVGEDKLKITSTSNQDSPIMDIATEKGVPLLCLDVWEHAYYLKYQNRRPEFIDAFWNVVNWDFVSDRYSKRKTTATT
ncbi:MAG TPA: superoxide dismutase [Bacteroidales bacterium]|nr:superoxide dismutase [Bacteroidales bacterium]